jgi:hypothetical protein
VVITRQDTRQETGSRYILFHEGDVANCSNVFNEKLIVYPGEKEPILFISISAETFSDNFEKQRLFKHENKCRQMWL